MPKNKTHKDVPILDLEYMTLKKALHSSKATGVKAFTHIALILMIVIGFATLFNILRGIELYSSVKGAFIFVILAIIATSLLELLSNVIAKYSGWWLLNPYNAGGGFYDDKIKKYNLLNNLLIDIAYFMFIVFVVIGIMD